MNYFKKHVVTPAFYVMKIMEEASLFNKWLPVISGCEESSLGCILTEPEKGYQRR